MPARLSRHKNYNLVDDTYDTRIPLHNEEAFQHGINFKAKYIGTLDVPRPTGRMEIVVAMRKIRFEFKAKQIKKRKVNVSVSVDGVKIMLRKKKKRKEWTWDEQNLLIMQDPVYRIFYVSHDSHDLKIWSYIARDSNSNKFRCNVFKSTKKSQAMRIVRTIGQAFEVCHKFGNTPAVSTIKSRTAETNSEQERHRKKDAPAGTGRKESLNFSKDDVEETDIDAVDMDEPSQTPSTHRGVTNLDTIQKKESIRSTDRASNSTGKSAPFSNTGILRTGGMMSSSHHQMQLMQQRVHQAEQQAQVAIAQVQLLKDQLAAESVARIEAQSRNHQLMLQNRELITHMSQMIAQLKEYERGGRVRRSSSSSRVRRNSEKLQQDLTNTAALIADASVSPPAPLFSPYSNVNEGALADDRSLFENTNTHLPLYGSPISQKSPSMGVAQQQVFSDINSASIVVNDHIDKAKGRNFSHANGVGDSSLSGHFDSSESSSSSSSSEEDEEMTDSITMFSSRSPYQKTAFKSELGHSVSYTKPLTKPMTNLLSFDQTENTSIWTSGVATPSTLDDQQHSAADSTHNVTTSLLSATHSVTTSPDSSIMNGYTLSPILSLEDGKKAFSVAPSRNKSEKSVTGGNPIRWHRPSPPLNSSDSKQQGDLPRIDPPPKPNRRQDLSASYISSSQTNDSSTANTSLFSVTETTLPIFDNQNTPSKPNATEASRFEPVKPAKQSKNFSQNSNISPSEVRSYQPQVNRGAPQTSSGNQKLFEIDPAEYERQLKYEPLHKVQASMWHESALSRELNEKKPTREASFKSKTPSKPKRNLQAPVIPHNDTDVTIGSLLDNADIPADAFTSDFWNDDVEDSLKSRHCASNCSDNDDPLAVLEKLNTSSPIRTPSFSKIEKSLFEDDSRPFNVKSGKPSSLPSQNLPLSVDHLASFTSLNDDTPVLTPLLSPATSKKKPEISSEPKLKLQEDADVNPPSSSDSNLQSKERSNHDLDAKSSAHAPATSEEAGENRKSFSNSASSTLVA